MLKLIAIALSFGCLVATVRAWEGTVTLFDDTNFHGGNYIFHVSETQTCYNVDGCFGDRASSIKWAGVPIGGNFSDGALIFFYEKPDCNKFASGDWPNASRGKVRGWRVSEPYPPQDLGYDGLDNMISSFMIWESSGTAERYRDACWHG